MFIVYSKNYCPYCDMAKSFLESQGTEYEERNIEGKIADMQELVEISGMMTVPQIFRGEVSRENLIGGYDDMMKKYESWELFS